MEVLQARVFRETWLLGAPRSLEIYENGCRVATRARTDVHTFFVCVDRSALARLLRMTGSSPDLERVLIDRIESGSLRLLREDRPRLQLGPGIRPEPLLPLPRPIPPFKPEPVLDDPRALVLTECDPFFAPGSEQLRAIYLLRKLESKQVVVRVINPRIPGGVVLERELEPSEKRDGSHVFSWDGVFQLGPEAGRFATPLDGPFELCIEHAHPYRGVAEFCVLYHSIEVACGSWHLGEAEPVQAEQVRWARWRLAELGFHGGPVDARDDEGLERAVLSYRAATPGLEREGGLDAAVLESLAGDATSRDWQSSAAFGNPEALVVVRSDFGSRRDDQDKLRFEARAPVALPLAAKVRLLSKNRSPVTGSPAVGSVRLRWNLIASEDRDNLVWDVDTIAGYHVEYDGDAWSSLPLTEAPLADHVAQAGLLLHPAMEGDALQVHVELALDRAEHAADVLAAHERHLATSTFEATSARFELRPFAGTVHVVEVDDFTFATDRKLLMPDGGLGALIVILEFAREHPNKLVLIAGHTDTAGSDAHNLELSEKRARNVQLWLSGDVDAWAADCQANYEIADFKAVHLWAHQQLGWNCDPGEIDDQWHTQAKVARDVFRTQCEALLEIELEHHVKQNEADWRAIDDLYALIVARYLELSVEELAELRKSIVFTDPATLACGEEFPRERPTVDDEANATNRRVEVIFFEPNEVPDLAAEPLGVSLYGGERFTFEPLEPWKLDPLTPAIFEIDIQLVDHWHREPLRSTSYTIEGPLPERLFHREGTTDGEGVLYEELLPSGHYELILGDVRMLIMAHPVKFTPNFRDVVRVPTRTGGVFPPRPGQFDEEWEVPAYVEGPSVDDDDVLVEDEG